MSTTFNMTDEQMVKLMNAAIASDFAARMSMELERHAKEIAARIAREAVESVIARAFINQDMAGRALQIHVEYEKVPVPPGVKK